MIRAFRLTLLAGAAAAALAGGTLAPAYGQTAQTVAALTLRISDLEALVRSLTGQVDEAMHLIQLLEARIAELEAQLGLGETPVPTATGVATIAPGSALAAIISRPMDLAAIASGIDPAAAAAGQPAAPPPATATDTQSTPVARAAYDVAYNHLLDGNTDAAAAAFQQFLVDYPAAGLAADARFWLGDIYLGRMMYAEAGNLFLDVIQLNPDSAKVPDSYLRLGMALAGLGQTTAACSAFSALLDRYPDAAQALKDRVAAERATASCPA